MAGFFFLFFLSGGTKRGLELPGTVTGALSRRSVDAMQHTGVVQQ
jgi:hypothetical protein